ncbi:MAG TPA: DUF4169 family protein [Alphaproteobacteria bacterium]|nr:DUF4169 family protein [Alphaproteobacteria bacterium]
MADVLSLSKARKARALAEKEARAEANRLRFGRTKAEKQRDAAEHQRLARIADAHKRQPD